MKRHTLRFVLVTTVVLRFSGTADATELVPGQVEIDARMFMENLRQVYKTAETYSHACSWTQTTEGLEGMDSMFIDGQERSSTFFFQRPDKFAIHTDDQHVVTDGTTIWNLDLKTRRYTENAVDDEVPLAWTMVSQSHPMDMPFISVIDYLVSEDESDTTSCQGTEDSESWLPRVTIDEVNGTPGKRVSWSVQEEDGSSRGGMWVSDINGAIFELESHAAGQHWPGGQGSGIDPVSYSVRTLISCRSVEINPALDPGIFNFVPDGDTKKVEHSYPSTFELGPPWEDRVAPTVQLTEGSLDEINANRLISQTSVDQPNFRGRVGVTTTDEDFDGVPDVLMIGYPGIFSIFNGATGENRSVRLRGRPGFGSLRTIIPIPNRGGTLWFAQTDHYHADSSSSRSTGSLHGPDGDEWWVYSPEIPDNRTSRMIVAAGDLDGDGISEIVVGVVVEHHRPTGDRSYTIDTESSMLTILDIEGNRLIQRQVDSEIHGIVIRGRLSGQSATILCVTGSGVEEFALAP